MAVAAWRDHRDNRNDFGHGTRLVPVMMLPILKKRNEVSALEYIVFRGGLETIVDMATGVSWLLLPLSRVYQVGIPDSSNLHAFGTLLLDAKEINSIGAIAPTGAR
jgi:hypothetical protein